MSNNLALKKGLNVPVKGEAAPVVIKTVSPDVVAVKPTDFTGLVPRLLVKEGDAVQAGSPLMSDKMHPEILFTSPVSGTVQEIVRGAKRKLLAVLVKADAKQEYVDFGKEAPKSAEATKELLLKTGLWGALIQRPYGVMASLDAAPKAIFISAFSTAPLAADVDYVLEGALEDFQAGISALAKVAPVHVSLHKGESAFTKVKDAQLHVVSGPHPAGNVGVQISHLSPIKKGEIVWTMNPVLVAAFGHVINTGKLDLTRKVAVTGPAAGKIGYVVCMPGTPVKEITSVDADVRVVGGDVLSGENLGADGCLGFFQNQLTLLKEGTEREWFGWAKPFRPKVHSSSWCYFSWLTPKKEYEMNTNLHGGPRAFVETKCFEDVTPMDIFPIYLIKACLAGDIEKMEKFGIYEVLPEDLALCEYVDPSKNEIQAYIQKGIDLMIKEMA
ncbi:MAG TPA: NADH:ubiquinone reductase (Na(+)-transporting) subunit A [Rikenellaceae bacterium]|nr:Na(+)-translocating NADH-quinone reductase subunit A [Bacteroidales bacterium]HAC40699.1 NADH:ubiquinone reductase (Na(+)-transporting) subunit A [Rikenellaceae bacterium]